MKKLFFLTLASMMAVFAMAGNGSSKAEAIEFNWDEGVTHYGGPGTQALWYRVDLSPLKEEENPSLTLYVTNPSRDESVKASMSAVIMGNHETKDYTILPHQYKTYTENASLLIRMQDVIYLTLKADGIVKLSAKVFESTDLDETCKDARILRWNTETTQTAGYAAWWRLDILPIKDADNKDAKITITNKGTKELTLKAGQSLDCPSSGLTKRTFTLAAGETMYDTIPQSMTKSVQPSDIYFSIENDQPISMKVELIDQPAKIEENAIIKETDPYTDLHVETDAIDHMPQGTTLYRFSVAEMRDTAKYEPEFTYRNVGTTPAKVVVKMAFEVPAYGTNNTEYEIAPGEEEIVVYKKNFLEGLEDVPYIYLLTTVEGDVQFTSRFKHIREGKACKTNIDFNWETGHVQEARTTQWYAVYTKDAREAGKNLIVHVLNQGAEAAKVKASFAFNCPTKGDEQEMTRTIAANGKELTHTISWTSYSMMKDTVWFGIETSQDIKFWLTTEDAETHAPDTGCVDAPIFPWDGFEYTQPNDTVWYTVPMDTLRKTTEFPIFYIYNRGNEKVTIQAEMAIDCPNELPREKRTLTIPAGGVYKADSIKRSTFNGIQQEVVYLRIIANQPFALEMLMREKPAGSACDAALPFNWEIGNDQKAGDDLWYEIDLKKGGVYASNKDVKISVTNKENTNCSLSGWLSYNCSGEENPISRTATLKANEIRSAIKENSWFKAQATDSMLYVRVKGTTALHLQAELVDPAPFDPIEEDQIVFIPLKWEQTYTQEQDTAWYYVSKEQLNILAETMYVPQATITNLAGADTKVRVDYAFHLPITQTMLNKSWTIKNGGNVSETMAPMNRDQYIKNDSVLIRVIANGKIEINTTLINPYDGGECKDAIRLGYGDQVEQEAYTIRWYRINIAKIKQAKDLHGKSVTVNTKNLGTGSATIKVGLFDSCDGDNLFEQYADRAKRTVSAGKTATRSFPAYVVYGLADNDIYVRVETNQPLSFSTSLSDYAPAEPDPNQQKAKLVVPGVDYYIPADSTVWYRACIPSLFRNYELMENSRATFENLSADQPAKIKGTACFQDTLTYAIPVRERSVAAGRSVIKTWRELAEKAFNKATGKTIDLSDQKLSVVDSMIRHFIDTTSHNAVQVRLRTSQPLHFRLDGFMQTKGDAINNPMLFDWEHGNVNPMNQLNWYLVDLQEGIERLPEGKELRLHVTNWSNAEAKATATVHLDVNTPKEQQRTINYTLKANEDAWRNIDRKLLIGDSNPLIEFTSEADVHIWAEVVDARERGKVNADTTLVACDGDELTNPYTGIKWTVDFEDPTTTYKYDSIPFINDTVAAEWDSICTVTVVERKDVSLLAVPAEKIVVKKGEVLNMSEATNWLLDEFEKQHNQDDTVKVATKIIWEWSINEANTEFEPIPTTPLTYEGIVLRYRVVTECQEDTITLQDPIYNTVYVTDDSTNCRPIVWNNKTYTAEDCKGGPVTADPVKIGTTIHGCDSIMTLTINVTGPVKSEDTLKIQKLCSYTWTIIEKGQTKEIGKYTTTGKYEYTTETADGQCDSIIYLDLTILTAQKKDTTVNDRCKEYEWPVTGITYNKSDKYTATVKTADGECDSLYYTLDLQLLAPNYYELEAVSKYNNRLLMINRFEINNTTGWALDSLGAYSTAGTAPEIKWYRADDTEETNKTLVGTGYYISSNEPLVGVYWAEIEVPTTKGGCGMEYGYTKKIVCLPSNNPAPALMPSLVRPGEEIRIVNLDPETETFVRIYTTEGMLQSSYTVRGEDSFTIKAAAEHGFYLVELSGEGIKSTLRYIVK